MREESCIERTNEARVGRMKPKPVAQSDRNGSEDRFRGDAAAPTPRMPYQPKSNETTGFAERAKVVSTGAPPCWKSNRARREGWDRDLLIRSLGGW